MHRLLLLLAALASTGCTTPSHRPLPTVARVDLTRYAGRWYEIARLPNPFQNDRARAIADYTVQADGSVKVVNTELREDGHSKAIEGRATAVAGSGDARLQVKFGGLAALAPSRAEGNYWIIALEPDYSVALVGTPSRKYLWLLARTSHLKAATRQRYLEKARALGFPVERIISPRSLLSVTREPERSLPYPILQDQVDLERNAAPASGRVGILPAGSGILPESFGSGPVIGL